MRFVHALRDSLAAMIQRLGPRLFASVQTHHDSGNERCINGSIYGSPLLRMRNRPQAVGKVPN
jgi:hypothetical protein